MNDEIMILPMIAEYQGRPVTTSRIVAEHFGKRHDSVLRDIANLREQLEQTPEGTAFNLHNFVEISQPDSMGRNQPVYILTRDGFTLLAMGFTGEKALRFKVAYIDAFNRMERLLTGGRVPAVVSRSVGSLHTGATDDNAVVAFLEAVKAAIKSGNVYLQEVGRPRRRPNPAAQLLGYISGGRAELFAVPAYRIYEAHAPAPVGRIVLYGMLQSAGVMAPTVKGKRRKRVTEQGTKKDCISLDYRYLMEE